MTTRILTVTDHLLEAQAICDEPLTDRIIGAPERERLDPVMACIERALNAIQTARCEAMAALDKF